MSVSNDTYAWFVRNRIVTLEMMTNDFMEYVQEADKRFAHSVYGISGFFNPVTMAADGNDKFELSAPFDPDTGILEGHEIMDLDALQADVEGVQFENTSAIDYHVGLRPTLLPENIVVNPKDGLPNWTKIRHLVGVPGNPDAVVDNGNGTITFTVDGITEAGVSNAGRTVKVCQVVGVDFAPAKGAITDAIALEILTVAWDGSNNKITTVGGLGQTTISTTPGDYIVSLVGPHVLRNTDISSSPDYAYVGTVQGAGAGNPPTVFDTTGQSVVFRSVSNLWHVLREEDVGGVKRWKIDVKALAGESGVDQIRVTDSASVVKFSVDEAGNVTVEGDLDVKGTTTTRDVDQVNAYNAYFDNLDAGNADTDVHNIKGEWTHTSSGGGITAFAIDGDTGKVGIGGSYDTILALRVTGGSFYTDDLIPAATACLGSPSAYWCDIYATTYHIGGPLLPDVTDSFDIGTTPLKWRDLYLSGATYIGVTGAGTDEKNWALEIVSGANEVLTLATKTDGWTASVAFFEAKRTADSTAVELLTLTATSVEIAGALLLSTGVGEGVATDLYPVAGTEKLGTYDIATETGRLWADLAVKTGTVADAAPKLRIFQTGQAADEGGWQFRGALTDLFLETIDDAGASGGVVFAAIRGAGATVDSLEIVADLNPNSHDTYDLGESGTPKKWKDAFFTGTVEGGQFTATDLVGSGGGADTVTFTAGTAATASPGATVLAGGNQNAGFIKIFVADTVAYLAYWTVIA